MGYIKVGQFGELTAERFLISKGYIILAKNFRFKRYGEIDLIALNRSTLVVVEVKTRRSTNFGKPYEAITPEKLRKIRLTVSYFLQQNPNLKRFPIAFEAVSVVIKDKAYVTHLKQIL